MSQTLREYQVRALDGCRASIARGRKRVLLVAPTGSGKTTIASAIIRSAAAKGRRCLFLGHRRELIAQCVNRLAEHDIEAGVIMAGAAPVDRQVQVASIQTLMRRSLPPVDLLIIDEAHHARARTYQRVLAAYPDAPCLGLTATPWRTDGRGLGELFEDVVVAARPRELIDAGHLVPIAGFVYDAPELTGVKTTGGDYDEDEAAEAMRYVGGNVVQRWLDTRPGRSVLFACTIAHSQALTASFVAAGVRAEHLDGTTPVLARDAILARLASGETELVCNVGVLTEGYDLPSLRCVILARPTKSEGLYIQMAGRGLRPAEGKTCLRLHDHAGNALRHGLVDEDRDYSLARDTKRETEPAERTKTCPQCFAIFRPAAKCPACGFVFEVKSDPTPIVEVVGEELELEAVRERRKFVPERMARPAYVELAEEGKRRGYRPGWAKLRFKARFGWWPKKVWTAAYDAEPPPPPAQTDAELRLLGAVDKARRAWGDARDGQPDEHEDTERPCVAER